MTARKNHEQPPSSERSYPIKRSALLGLILLADPMRGLDPPLAIEQAAQMDGKFNSAVKTALRRYRHGAAIAARGNIAPQAPTVSGT